MTNARQSPIAGTCDMHMDRGQYSLVGGVEPEVSNHKAGCEYLPMDVFVDSETMRQHFQCSSINTGWAAIRVAFI